MALNKFMHPRNIYKIPPDFSALSKKYAEFAKIAKTEINGKVTINFKDPHSLRILTRCLLHCDFNLVVEIPEDRLVPTLPLRLNYILWIEDIMSALGKNNNIKGLDIGTGACAIYPLLAATKNNWQMVGTETDKKSVEIAQKNVDQNNLQKFITISKNETDTLVEYLFQEESDLQFDFCMCNPPFYSTLEELCESRSMARPEPKNCFTGSLQELITEGGELQFIRKLIVESRNYKEKISIYTTMIGQKYHLKLLLQDLKTAGIRHTHTEFCQGRTTRWGLAWTYNSYDIENLVAPREKIRKKSTPLSYNLPELPGAPYNIENVFEKLKKMMDDLTIKYTLIMSKKGHKIVLQISAFANTWSNQRRKKRLMKRIENEEKKKAKFGNCDEGLLFDVSIIPRPKEKNDVKTSQNNYKIEHVTNANTILISRLKNETAILNNNNEMETCFKYSEDIISKVEVNEKNSHPNNNKEEQPSTSNEFIKLKSVYELTNLEAQCSNVGDNAILKSDSKSIILQENNKMELPPSITAKNIQCIQCSSESGPAVVQAILKIIKNNNVITLELDFLTGSGGKECVHQILQYIKNNWK